MASLPIGAAYSAPGSNYYSPLRYPDLWSGAEFSHRHCIPGRTESQVVQKTSRHHGRLHLQGTHGL